MTQRLPLRLAIAQPSGVEVWMAHVCGRPKSQLSPNSHEVSSRDN